MSRPQEEVEANPSTSVEQQLQLSEARLRGILSSVLDGIIAIDEKGLMLSANPAALKLFGYDEEELVGQNVSLLMPQPYQSEHDGYMANYLRTGDAKIIGIGREVVGKRKDGSTFPMALAVSEVVLEDGRIFTGIVRDITERKQMIDDLKKARDEALEASRLKSAFLANMSHEIRTPMNAIIGISELLDESNLSNEQRLLNNTSRTSARSLLNLVNDILDYSRLAAGKMLFQSEPFHLRSLLDDVVEMVASAARSNEVEVRIDIDRSVPEEFVADKSRLRQVLVNLVGNAVKFTEKGLVLISATCLDRDDRSARIRFAVNDTGSGIPSEKLDLIFEQFVQADASDTRKHGGSGLGLAIVKEIVSNLGGSVSVDSTEGIGSTFVFEVSIALPSQERATAENSSSSDISNDVTRKVATATVLLVEDNPVNQLVASKILESTGVHVEIAQNGQEALDMLEARDYDVVFMDIQMPVLDGYDATREIRKREESTGKHIPIVALTASAMKGDRERFLAVGMDDYLAKPVSPKDLRDVLAKYLEKG